jgi:anti-sigma-K factor RskA
VTTQEYISSGIIESYVLGLASEEERKAFEKMCDENEELRLALDAFELSLEQNALLNAVPPPPNLRKQVLDKMENEKQQTPRIPGKVQTKAPVKTLPVAISGSKRTTYLAAASVALLLVSVALNYYYFRQYKTYSDKYDALLVQNAEIVKNDAAKQVRLDEYTTAMKHLKDPGMAIIKMEAKGVSSSADPSSLATIYWDTRTKDVFLLINNMPQPSSGKQYQLWAIVDGLPVDAGIVDMSGGLPVVKMKNIPRAEAFAVTLEENGGSVNPHMDQLCVFGKVS